jgi:hypothetical protein
MIGEDQPVDSLDAANSPKSRSAVVYEGLGTILGNLLSLELLLRVFLYEALGEEERLGPKSAHLQTVKVDEWVPKSHLNDYSHLRHLIDEANRELEKRARRESVDRSLADLRDDLVHCRVFVGTDASGPFRLVKFARPQKDAVQVIVSTDLTARWFQYQAERTRRAAIGLEVVVGFLFPGAVSRALGPH